MMYIDYYVVMLYVMLVFYRVLSRFLSNWFRREYFDGLSSIIPSMKISETARQDGSDLKRPEVSVSLVFFPLL